MTRRIAIAIALAFAAFAQASGELITEVITNRVEYDGVEWIQGNAQGATTGAYLYIPNVHINGFDEVFFSAIAQSDFDRNQTQCLWCSRGDDTTTGTITAFYISNSGIRLDYNNNIDYYTGFYPSRNSYFTVMYREGNMYINGTVVGTYTQSDFTSKYGISIFCSYIGATIGQSNMAKFKVCEFYVKGLNNIHLIPIFHDGQGKMINLVDGQLYANAGTGAFTYGAVTGKVAYVSITTNAVYHANPPIRSFDAASPWNAPDRTRLAELTAPHIVSTNITRFATNIITSATYRPTAKIKNKED